MGRISAEEKLIAVKRRLEGGESFEAIAKFHGCTSRKDSRMVQEVSEHGIRCICEDEE